MTLKRYLPVPTLVSKWTFGYRSLLNAEIVLLTTDPAFRCLTDGMPRQDYICAFGGDGPYGPERVRG